MSRKSLSKLVASTCFCVVIQTSFPASADWQHEALLRQMEDALDQMRYNSSRLSSREQQLVTAISNVEYRYYLSPECRQFIPVTQQNVVAVMQQAGAAQGEYGFVRNEMLKTTQLDDFLAGYPCQ